MLYLYQNERNETSTEFLYRLCWTQLGSVRNISYVFSQLETWKLNQEVQYGTLISLSNQPSEGSLSGVRTD
jgi:hypothetical protein